MPTRRVPTAARSDPAAPQPAACAAEVLDVVPSVLDAVRTAMRSHVGAQLSVPQFRCLAFVSREPACSIGDVAAFLGVTMPTASAMVDRLVRAGAVAPRPDPADRRRAQLQVTPAGRAQMQRIRRGAQGDLARLLSERSDDELRALMAGLGVLRRTFLPSR